MPATVTVLYPSTSDSTFAMDYYMKTHMPLVMKHWGPEGLQGYNVTNIVGTPTGDPAPYSVQCALEWGSVEQAKKAMGGPSAPPVFGDIPNFSNKQPVVFMGDDVGRS